ncbi:predicted protein [Nematostella vectensis]|uniref:ornithine decarboxylase n=2 Tax=Nematostella vectensis TaxID=45351 RepID=A7RWL7_NEMVE|nr:predicted protein [Nematostella vectensis]|eukprot:XP_001636251.1 predicted protein [Nematostella vectensis]
MKQSIGTDLAIEIVKDGLSHRDVITEKIDSLGREEKDDAFYIVDLADVVLKHKKWVQLLPRVEPFYAMKCNNDPAVLKLLAGLGLGFDCASKGEIQTILGLGVSPKKIVYANPCKQASHIKYASQHDVAMTTFDNEMELHKIKKLYPDAQLILRIRTDDSKSLCQLGIKFGAPLKQCRHLLKVAQDLGLNVVGVSFHVGSGCFDASAYATAVIAARSVFNLAVQFGFNCTLLDIGGGFPGDPNAAITFEEICTTINPLLEEHFPPSSGVRIIAEPGRYYSSSSFTLAVNVYSRREVQSSSVLAEDVTAPENNGNQGFMYYVNDGVYGSFNCLIFDHATVEAIPVKESSGQPLYQTSIWGPTCDSMDCITKNMMLPKVEVGEWLFFKYMGAYTQSAASTFNGFKKPTKFYLCTEELW